MSYLGATFRSRRQLEDLNHAHLCLGGPEQRNLRRRARSALIPTLMRLNSADPHHLLCTGL